MARFFVYNTNLPGDGFGGFPVVRWGRSPLGEFSDQIVDAGDVVLENTTGYQFNSSDDPGVITVNYYNPTTLAFSVSATSSIISPTGDDDPTNYKVQGTTLSTTQDRLLRYSGNEGSFGLGATVMPLITDFSAVSPPTGFYYCDGATVVGGPTIGAYTCSVLVQRTTANGVMFQVSRMSADANYREWVGVRAASSGAVTWLEFNSRFDSAWSLRNNADITKIGTFDLASITTGTTRTLTWPNASGIIALSNATQTISASWTFSATPTISAASANLGTSTAAGTLNIGSGALISGATRTVNIGTGGVSGSISNIAIGAATAGALGTITFNSPTVTFGGNVTMFNMNNADLFTRASAHNSISAAATLTVANLKTTAVVFTGTVASNLTMPTGTDLDTGFPGVGTNTAMDFTIINTGSAAATMLASTGVTIIGSAVVAAGTSATFKIRRTGTTATWILYRI